VKTEDAGGWSCGMREWRRTRVAGVSGWRNVWESGVGRCGGPAAGEGGAGKGRVGQGRRMCAGVSERRRGERGEGTGSGSGRWFLVRERGWIDRKVLIGWGR
jgi:hypothetical protein